jgi:hypothetical protein
MTEDRAEVREMVFEIWKAEAQEHADRLSVVGGDLLWVDGDPYELANPADSAFTNGESPSGFIESIFEDDLGRQTYDKELERESVETAEVEEDVEEDEEEDHGDVDELW